MKSTIYNGQNRVALKFINVIKELLTLLKNKYFYVGLVTLILGIRLNFYSQDYLLNYIQNSSTLPVLSDLILDNIPLWDIDFIYDIFSLISLSVLFFYIIHKAEFKKVPYFLLLCGIFHLIRGAFIVLTPFGNPTGFDGTEGLFNGFSNIELGVYPSGHIGISFMYFLFVKNKTYKTILILCVIIIALALFLSRGHYTIDILSGILFAYAIKSFGDKHLLNIMTN